MLLLALIILAVYVLMWIPTIISSINSSIKTTIEWLDYRKYKILTLSLPAIISLALLPFFTIKDTLCNVFLLSFFLILFYILIELVKDGRKMDKQLSQKLAEEQVFYNNKNAEIQAKQYNNVECFRGMKFGDAPTYNMIPINPNRIKHQNSSNVYGLDPSIVKCYNKKQEVLYIGYVELLEIVYCYINNELSEVILILADNTTQSPLPLILQALRDKGWKYSNDERLWHYDERTKKWRYESTRVVVPCGSRLYRNHIDTKPNLITYSIDSKMVSFVRKTVYPFVKQVQDVYHNDQHHKAITKARDDYDAISKSL